MTRRQFIAGMGLGSVALYADPLGFPIGCQVYPVRQDLAKDFDGTLRNLAGIGYKNIEMCSPPGYVHAGFGPLADLKAADLLSRIHSAGLECESCHYQFPELKQNLDERIAFAHELGLKQMILSTFGLARTAKMDDWMRAANELNSVGEKVQNAGMQLGYHNHTTEFAQLDGALVYDKLMGAFDPKLVKMQFQVSVVSLGYEAATYLTRYPSRFISLHLQDWSTAEKKEVPIGQGSVDWRKLFAAARKAGVKNYFVEMNMDAQSQLSFSPGIEGLKGLPVVSGCSVVWRRQAPAAKKSLLIKAF